MNSRVLVKQSAFQSVEEVFIIQHVCGQEELRNEEQILPNHGPLLTIADHYTQWALTILDLCYLQVNRVQSHFKCKLWTPPVWSYKNEKTFFFFCS